MRLLHCRLRQVRQHDDLSLSFDPGLTRIGGANETGKSTLVEALHRALFLRASATGAPVEALRARRHGGHPVVEVGFEARGDRWTLLKRFSGSSGTASLASAGGERFAGAAAEERLAALLGVAETLGSRQAARELPTRWAHLWVLQGQAGKDPFGREILGRDPDPAAYELETLVEQLERGGGAALQSPLDQQVANRIDEALAENFTAGRGDLRRQGPLALATRALEAAQVAHDQARERLEAFEAAGEELARLGERLEALRSRELPALRERQRRRAEQTAEVARLDAALALRRKESEPDHQRLTSLRADRDEAAALEREVARLQEQLRAQQAAARLEEDQAETLERERATAEERRSALEAHRQRVEGRGQLAQRLLERARGLAERERLRTALERGRAEAAAGRELERKLGTLPAIGAATVARLRSLEREALEARARHEALAVGVELRQADRPVWLDGTPLEPGGERRLDGEGELRVGEGVVLRIRPGGGGALEQGRDRRATAERRLAAALAEAGAESLEAAEGLARERERLQHELEVHRRPPGPTADPAALQEALEALEGKLAALEAEIDGLAAVREEMEAEGPLPAGAEDLEQLHRGLQQSWASLNTAVRQAEAALRDLDQRREGSLRRRAQEAEGRARLETEGAAKRQRLETLRQRHGPAEALAAAVAELERRVGEADGEIARLAGRLTELQRELAPTGAAELEQAIARAEAEVADLIGRQGAARHRCETLGEGDPHAALEQGRAALEAAAAEHRALRRGTEAQQLLRRLFAEARSDLSARYSEPLARAIDDYLAPLTAGDGGPACRLRFDPAAGFSGLQLRRGGDLYDFAALSGGMREQLTAALRLAMADVLKGAHDGCLPLLFDDAFTNCDPQRLTVVRRMVGLAVERGLQVILLTCDPAAYGQFGGRALSLPGPGS